MFIYYFLWILTFFFVVLFLFSYTFRLSLTSLSFLNCTAMFPHTKTLYFSFCSMLVHFLCFFLFDFYSIAASDLLSLSHENSRICTRCIHIRKRHKISNRIHLYVQCACLFRLVCVDICTLDSIHFEKQ